MTSFGGLGLYRLISSVSRAELQAFADDTLGPVLCLPELPAPACGSAWACRSCACTKISGEAGAALAQLREQPG